MADVFYPYWKINYPIWSKHRCISSKLGYLVNLEVVYNNKLLRNIHRIFCSGREIVTNSRVVELPLTLYVLGKYVKIGSKILDIGSCESPLPIFLACLGFDVVSVDINDYELSKLCTNLRFIKSDITLCEFGEGEFDAVTAISTIEHIGIGEVYGEECVEGKDFKLMDLVKLWLRDDGIFILSVPMEKEFRVIEGFERHYDFNTVAELLKGFKVLEEYYIGSKNGVWEIVGNSKEKNGNLRRRLCWIFRMQEGG